MTRYLLTLLLITSAQSSKQIDAILHRRFNFDSDGIYESPLGFNSTSRYVKYVPSQHSNPESQDIASFFLPAIRRIQDDRCRNQMHKFLQDLQNSSSWATKMFEATSKVPFGLVTANTYQFGNYEQCIHITESTESITGKYCLADIRFAPTRRGYPSFHASNMDNEFSLHYDPYKSVWEKFKVTRDQSKKRRDLFHSGICVPSGCSAQHVQILLDHMSNELKSTSEFEIDVNLSEKSCTTKSSGDFQTGAKILSFLVSALILSVIASTFWETTRKMASVPSSGVQKLMLSFSLRRNLAKLTAPDADDEMSVFHGMKTLSMILIIMGHRCLSSYGGPLFNPQFVEQRYRKFQDMLLMNGTLIVDTFFLIGGYITFIALFNAWQANKQPKASTVYFYRWLRLTPVYMLVVFFYGHLLEHLGNGPVWALRVGREAERCRNNWWTNLFYINNYINPDQMCMFQSWYVTCDMHYILVTPVLVKLIFKTPRRGLILLGTLILTSIVVPFTVTYYNGYDGVLRVYMGIFEDLASSFTFSNVYIKTHNRGTPYFIGIAAAYAYIHIKKSGYVFSLMQTWTYSLMATFFSLSAICGAWFFYIPGRPYDAMENALYASLHRVFWALSMAWVAIGGAQNAFGVIQPVLSGKIYVPLSRLCYGAFLMHGAIQMWTTTTLQTPEYMNYFKLFWMTSSDILLSFASSFLLYIFFEAPIKGIQNLLLFHQQTTQKSVTKEKEELNRCNINKKQLVLNQYKDSDILRKRTRKKKNLCSRKSGS